MLAPYFAEHYPWLGPYIDAHFGTIVTIYLIIGFIAGIVLLKIETSEEPVGTLLMVTLCWGLILPFVPFIVFFAALSGLLRLLGIEAVHTSNDRY